MANFEYNNAAKTQFYQSDGFGRDAYIHLNNGGFCPSKQATQIHGIGKFVWNALENIIYDMHDGP